MESKQWLTVREAARLTGYGTGNIYRMIRLKRVESGKGGPRAIWMVTAESLLEYIPKYGKKREMKDDILDMLSDEWFPRNRFFTRYGGRHRKRAIQVLTDMVESGEIEHSTYRLRGKVSVQYRLSSSDIRHTREVTLDTML